MKNYVEQILLEALAARWAESNQIKQILEGGLKSSLYGENFEIILKEKLSQCKQIENALELLTRKSFDEHLREEVKQAKLDI